MFEALAFLTVFGHGRRPTPRALVWFPVVGLLVGTAVGASWWLLDPLLPPLLAAVVVVAVDLAVTGALHADGLADAADGLLPHASVERRLAMMRSPDVGAFGAVAIVVVLLVRAAAFAVPDASVLLVAGIWCGSRAVVAVAPRWLRYARDSGAASPFLEAPVAWWPAIALLPAAALAVTGDGLPGGLALATTASVSVGVLIVARARVGGFTGDVLGAAIIVSETAGLTVAAARW